jgi:predicted dehydrogenase
MSDRRHKVLVIGVGSIGERHVRCFQATGRAELSIVEINAELRRTIADRYGVTPAFADLDAALADPPNVAVVCTPAPWHVPMATQLAELGVHILVEKPLSTSCDGIDRLLQTVRERSLTAGVAYVMRQNPLLRSMRHAIVDGRFGQPVELVAIGGQHFPTYRPAYRAIYYNDRATGGGAIQDALTHIINAGEWLLGPVNRLVADAAHQVLEGVSVEDTVHLLARHGDTLASYSLNQHQAPNEATITVICERGTARCEFHENRWRWMAAPSGDWHDESIAPLERDTLFIGQAHAFLDAVEQRTSFVCSLEEGLQTLRVNLAALESVEKRTWQSML